jgi:transposase
MLVGQGHIWVGGRDGGTSLEPEALRLGSPSDAVIDWEQIRRSGFHVLPHRWIVERTFAWLSTWRRRAFDYEVLPSSEQAWISIAMIPIMLRRLAQNSS